MTHWRRNMTIAFCGHSDYIKNSNDEKNILEILESNLKNTTIDFFLGEYGSFDLFAYECAKKFKENHTAVNLIFITPYISEQYQKNHIDYKKGRFDMILYPPLENVPLKYAISHRNRWIVEKADIIIAYITHKYGGAYTMYQYAKRKNKKIYNIAPQDID